MATRSIAAPARVRVPQRSWRHDARAVKMVLHRETIRFWRDRTRMVSMLVQPVLWLLVLGTGMGSVMTGGSGDFRTFMFPGVIAMSVIFTAMFSAGSIVWDREFGFLREMLVAPVSRSALVIGKCLGGALVATLQGLVVLALAGVAGVPYDPVLILVLIAEMFLAGFVIATLGVVMAARIKSMQAFFGVMQMAIMPMLFLSGAFFPLSRLPGWLDVLVRINPLTYAIDPMRRAVFASSDVPAETERTFNPGVTWFGWHVPVGLELLLLTGFGGVLLGVAIAMFRRDG